MRCVRQDAKAGEFHNVGIGQAFLAWQFHLPLAEARVKKSLPILPTNIWCENNQFWCQRGQTFIKLIQVLKTYSLLLCFCFSVVISVQNRTGPDKLGFLILYGIGNDS
jgi:hypothetical protein